MPRERPILFSSPMVRAILAGAKTQTRRVVKMTPLVEYDIRATGFPREADCPYGWIGDQFWVRETWAKAGEVGDQVEYRADNPDPRGGKWRPSFFMPRALSRIQLEITDVRSQQLQEISEDDAVAEGMKPTAVLTVGRTMEVVAGDMFSCPVMPAKEHFKFLWDGINGEREGCAWHENPFVWVVSFRRLRP